MMRTTQVGDNSDLKESLITTTAALCAIPGASGFEHDVVAQLVREFRPHVDEIDVDRMGNLYAVCYGASGGPRVMISAHSDEIGGVVRAIEPTGFLRFNKLGDVLHGLIVGRLVQVGRHLGIVGVKAGHEQSEEDRTRVEPHTNLYIDVGVDSEADVRKLGISVGDPITYNSPLQRLTNTDRICSKAIDNRLGCAVLLEVARRLERTSLAGTLYLVVTVQEEVGLRGAEVAANRVNPDCALVVDTIPCGDTPDFSSVEQSLPVGIGGGPVFRLVSRGDVMPLGVKRLLIESAERIEIPYQLVVHNRSTTDASAIHLQREGIPTGIITIPRRYAHSPVEVADINDAVHTVHLLEAVIAKFAELNSFLDFS